MIADSKEKSGFLFWIPFILIIILGSYFLGSFHGVIKAGTELAGDIPKVCNAADGEIYKHKCIINKSLSDNCYQARNLIVCTSYRIPLHEKIISLVMFGIWPEKLESEEE